MAEILGTASATVTLFETAVDLIQRIRAAHQRVRATSKTLEETTQQLDTLYHSIAFVKAEPNLHTAGVVGQVSRVTEAANELNAFFEKLRQFQQRQSSVRQHLHAFAFGNDEERELAAILSRLRNARSALMLDVQVSGVGLVGDLRNGFRVVAATLDELNGKVEEALEFKLRLHQMVANRVTGNDGTIEIRFDEIARLSRNRTDMPDISDAPFVGSDFDAAQNTTPNVQNEIYGNVTLDQARVLAGDIGVEEWQKKTGITQRNTIRDNNFGNGAHIVAGNVSGDVGKDFLQHFFK